MLALFSDPYPDELIYSALARSGDRLDYPSKTALVQELFNVKTASAVIDLPTHLDHLIESLPTGHTYTADYLIEKHTLLPFYGPFLPEERLKNVRKDMRGRGNARGRAALLKSSLPPLEWVRFCPVCFEEDRQRFGEAYWHRIHQIPGVEVCPKHAVFLELSTAKARNRSHPSEFISAERAGRMTPARVIQVEHPTQAVLLSLAQQAAWLLESHPKSLGLQDVSRRYHVLLMKEDLMTFLSTPNTDELLRAFRNSYPGDLLRLLHGELDGQIGNWIERVLRSRKAQHPILHLLLMNFLGCRVEEFFDIPTQYTPFGPGPWPCLNPACTHYQHLHIPACNLTLNVKSKRPVGTFSCECGFVYCRTGPQRGEEDCLKISKIKSFGPIWETKFQELWSDPYLQLRQVAQQLKVSAGTLRIHAARLHLPLPRPGGRSKTTRLDSLRRVWIPSPALVARYRAQWLRALQENPNAGLDAIRRKTQQLYPWLRTHDSGWLDEHLPETRIKRGASQVRVNWEQRDIQLASEVRAAGISLKGIPGRPVRIKRETIGRSIDRSTTLRKELHRLPLTLQALDEVVETPEMFAIRRLEWATELYRQEKFGPSRKQLIRRANIRGREELPGVREAIEGAMRLLENFPSEGSIC